MHRLKHDDTHLQCNICHLETDPSLVSVKSLTHNSRINGKRNVPQILGYSEMAALLSELCDADIPTYRSKTCVKAGDTTLITILLIECIRHPKDALLRPLKTLSFGEWLYSNGLVLVVHLPTRVCAYAHSCQRARVRVGTPLNIDKRVIDGQRLYVCGQIGLRKIRPCYDEVVANYYKSEMRISASIEKMEGRLDNDYYFIVHWDFHRVWPDGESH